MAEFKKLYSSVIVRVEKVVFGPNKKTDNHIELDITSQIGKNEKLKKCEKMVAEKIWTFFTERTETVYLICYDRDSSKKQTHPKRQGDCHELSCFG